MHKLKTVSIIEAIWKYHQSSGNNVSIDLVHLDFAYVIFAYSRSLDGVNDTNLVVAKNKKFNKVVAVMSRRFKTNDEAVGLKEIEFGNQLMEAIIVISKFERLNEYFTIRENGRGEMVELGDINANVDHGKHFLRK